MVCIWARRPVRVVWGLKPYPLEPGSNVAHTGACMHIQKYTRACTCTQVHTHNMQLSHVRACAHIHVRACYKGSRAAPALRAALSTPLSAAKVLAYGETCCCQDGAPGRHAEESCADGRVPAGRDHLRRSVVVEVSPRLTQGTGQGSDP